MGCRVQGCCQPGRQGQGDGRQGHGKAQVHAGSCCAPAGVGAAGRNARRDRASLPRGGLHGHAPSSTRPQAESASHTPQGAAGPRVPPGTRAPYTYRAHLPWPPCPALLPIHPPAVPTCPAHLRTHPPAP